MIEQCSEIGRNAPIFGGVRFMRALWEMEGANMSGPVDACWIRWVGCFALFWRGLRRSRVLWVFGRLLSCDKNAAIRTSWERCSMDGFGCWLENCHALLLILATAIRSCTTQNPGVVCKERQSLIWISNFQLLRLNDDVTWEQKRWKQS